MHSSISINSGGFFHFVLRERVAMRSARDDAGCSDMARV
jgi:hypothetical protein